MAGDGNKRVNEEEEFKMGEEGWRERGSLSGIEWLW